MKKKVVSTVPNNPLLQKIIFSAIYLNSKKSNNPNMMVGVGNNFLGISISPAEQTKEWGSAGDTYFKSKKYFCSTSNISYPIFDSIEDNIKFIKGRWEGRLNGYDDSPGSITKFLVLYNNTSIGRNVEVYDKLSETELVSLNNKVINAIKAFNETEIP